MPRLKLRVAKSPAYGAFLARARRSLIPLRRLERLEPRELLTGVTYQGGPLMNNVAVETVFLGSAWASDPALGQTAAQLDQFFASVTNSSFLDLLAQYGTPQAGPIGHGSYVGQVNLAEDAWRRSTISDSAIQNLLNSEIASGAIAEPDNNRLLFVFTPPNIVVSQGGTRSNGYPVGFAGYHNSFLDSAGNLVRYAVIPDPIGNDQVPTLTTLQQQTVAASHEMAEAITDPDGTSWWDNTLDATSGYEISDFANLSSNAVSLNGYAVEELWSNVAGGLAAPAGAATLQASITPPPETTLPSTTPAASGLFANLGRVAMELTHSQQYDATLVQAMYEQLLARAPDADGLIYWITQLQQGTTDEQMLAVLTASSEYATLHGDPNASWILAMYEDLLGRAADGPGLSYWLSQMQTGENRYQIALAIASSDEREALVVANDYQTFLGRTGSPDDISYWVNAFEHGAANEDVIAAFIASPEYYSASGDATAAEWIDRVYQDLYQSTPSANDLTYWLAQLD